MENSAAGMMMPMLFLVFFFLVIAGMWRTFTKAGKPGWASLIPIYNVIVMLQIAGRPVWWLLLFFIPFLNIIISLVVLIDLARSFGKGVGFGLGLFFLGFIFIPVLGFGSAQHVSAPGRA